MFRPEDLKAHNISNRAARLLTSPPMPAYLEEHFIRSGPTTEFSDTPKSYIPMCIAENRLVWPFLQPKMAECRDVPHRVLGYDAMTGSVEFRTQLSRFLSRWILGREFSPDQIAVLAGAGSVLEILFHALADQGEGILIPTPSYAGFWLDLETRNQLTIVPVHCSSGGAFELTTELLDAAVENADVPIRALLFTSPNNPLGTVYSSNEVEHVLQWAENAGIHVVFDEIYALSVFGERSFTSCASFRPTLGELVHIVWAFSKDFGASGLRCGVLVSENRAVLAAVDALAYWECCSGDTQYLLGEMISDESWVSKYVSEMQKLLRISYKKITAELKTNRIPFFPADAGFFFLLDLREYLASPTWEAESTLWRRLLDQTNVNLTPGSALRCVEPGFFRLCFASVPPETALTGVRRLASVLT